MKRRLHQKRVMAWLLLALCTPGLLITPVIAAGYVPTAVNLPNTSIAAISTSTLNLGASSADHTLGALNLAAGASETVLAITNAASLTVGGISASGATGQTARVTGATLKIASCGTVDVARNVTLTVQSTIAGTNVLDKTGLGVLALFAGVTNTYNGATEVNGGALLVNGTLDTQSSAVTVDNGGTLGGAGTINRPVDVNAGGTLSPSGGTTNPATLTVNNALTLSGFAAFNLGSATNYDRVVGVQDLAFGGTLEVTDTAGPPSYAAGQAYRLFSYVGSSSGVFTNLSLPVLGAGLRWNDFGGQPFDYTMGRIVAASTNESKVYWAGDQGDGRWDHYDGTNSNWSQTEGSKTEPVGLPLTNNLATVCLSMTGAVTTVTTLGSSFAVDGVVCRNGSSAVSIGESVSETLTLGPYGLTVESGGNAATISAPVVLTVSQPWVNNGFGTLTVGGVSLGGYELRIGGSGDTTIGGAITGAGGSLEKVAAGTLKLSGASTYGGGTRIYAGTLTVNGSLATGSPVAVATAGILAGNGTIGGNTTLDGNGIVNLTNPGQIMGMLGVTGGYWNGAGSVGGAVTVNNGTFTIGGGGNLTATNGLNVTSGGTIAGTGTINGSVNYTSSAGSTFAGEIAGLGSTLTLNNASANLTLSGVNSYTGPTTIRTGTLTVNGSLAPGSPVAVETGGTLAGSGTIGGNTTLTNGIVNLRAGGNIAGTLGAAGGYWNGAGSVGAAVTVNSGTLTIGTNATLTASNVVSITTAGRLAGSGTIGGNATLAGNGTISLTNPGKITGTFGVTGGYWNGTGSVGGMVTVNSGTFTIGTNATLTASNVVSIATAGTLAGSGTVSGNATLDGNGTINLTNPGKIAGTLGVTGGNWNGAGSVLGALTVNSGTFTIPRDANLTATNGVTVKSGGTLAGVGTVTGPVIVEAGGTLSPGTDSIGSVLLGSALNLQSGSTLSIELAPGTNDCVLVTGAASLGGRLSVSLINGIVLADEQVFGILAAGSGATNKFTNQSGAVLNEDALVATTDTVLLRITYQGKISGTNGVSRTGGADVVLYTEEGGTTFIVR